MHLLLLQLGQLSVQAHYCAEARDNENSVSRYLSCPSAVCGEGDSRMALVCSGLPCCAVDISRADVTVTCFANVGWRLSPASNQIENICKSNQIEHIFMNTTID